MKCVKTIIPMRSFYFYFKLTCSEVMWGEAEWSYHSEERGVCVLEWSLKWLLQSLVPTFMILPTVNKMVGELLLVMVGSSLWQHWFDEGDISPEYNGGTFSWLRSWRLSGRIQHLTVQHESSSKFKITLPNASLNHSVQLTCLYRTLK